MHPLEWEDRYSSAGDLDGSVVVAIVIIPCIPTSKHSDPPLNPYLPHIYNITLYV